MNRSLTVAARFGVSSIGAPYWRAASASMDKTARVWRLCDIPHGPRVVVSGAPSWQWQTLPLLTDLELGRAPLAALAAEGE